MTVVTTLEVYKLGCLKFVFKFVELKCKHVFPLKKKKCFISLFKFISKGF